MLKLVPEFETVGAATDGVKRATGKKEWKEFGVGPLKIMIHKETDKRRLLMRNEKSGKILLNSYIFPAMAFEQGKNNIRFMAKSEEEELDDKGNMLHKTKAMDVQFCLKMKPDDTVEAMAQLRKAVP